jgi:hypothetical protein
VYHYVDEFIKLLVYKLNRWLGSIAFLIVKCVLQVIMCSIKHLKTLNLASKKRLNRGTKPQVPISIF